MKTQREQLLQDFNHRQLVKLTLESVTMIVEGPSERGKRGSRILRALREDFSDKAVNEILSSSDCQNIIPKNRPANTLDFGHIPS